MLADNPRFLPFRAKVVRKDVTSPRPMRWYNPVALAALAPKKEERQDPLLDYADFLLEQEEQYCQL